MHYFKTLVSIVEFLLSMILAVVAPKKGGFDDDDEEDSALFANLNAAKQASGMSALDMCRFSVSNSESTNMTNGFVTRLV